MSDYQAVGLSSRRTIDTHPIQQLALPRTLRNETLKAYHDNSSGGAHLGIEKVMAAMKSKYNLTCMHQEIYDYIHSCDTC